MEVSPVLLGPELFPGIKPIVRKTRSTSISPATRQGRLLSPGKKLLTTIYEEKLRVASRKVNRLQKSKLRAQKKIASLKNVLTELKNKRLLSSEFMELLQNISGPNKNILRRQLQKSQKVSTQRVYEPELRSFALTLHYYSPVAYNFVRSKFNSCLPHPKTLSRWYHVVDGNPGFTQEALTALKIRSEQSNHPILCALIFDEMAIRQKYEYDGSKFYGNVDMGHGISNDAQTLAKEALVFLVVGINASWKVPVGYFLSDGIKADKNKIWFSLV